MLLVTDTKDLGSGVIGGVECNHLAFRTAEVDWQIWIAAGDKRYHGFPQYTLDLRNWTAGSEVAADDFSFKAPADAQKFELSKPADTNELPDMLVSGGSK